MPIPTAFRITVTEVFDVVELPSAREISAREATNGHVGREVFAQSLPAEDFDMQSFVLALNKRRRVRKSRGKEETKNAKD
jgi:hypothetical protein